MLRTPLLVAAAALLGAPTSAGLSITEFLAINDTGVADGHGDTSDWIEIWNDGPTPRDLAGWHLTDDPLDLTKWTFPSYVLQPDERVLVWASGKDLVGPPGELHTNFQLDGGGEYLAFVRPDGVTIETGFGTGYPDQFSDVSYGFGLDLALQPAEGHFAVPTPLAPNGTVALPVADVEYDVDRGYHDAPFTLGLLCATPNTLIRYTLDGSEPTQASTLYTAPLAVSTTTIVRAIAYRTDVESLSKSTTSSYLFPAAVLTQSDAGAIAAGFPVQWIQEDGTTWSAFGGHPDASYGLDTAVTALYTAQEFEDGLKSIPTVSLVMSIDDWFGYNPPAGPFGIYANSASEGPEWDRTCSFEYIDPDGGPEIQVNCGVAIQGGSSTAPDTRGQLSMALKFRSDLGVSKLDFPLFEGSPVESFDYLILDGGNEDGLYTAGGSTQKKRRLGVRDQLMAEIQREMGWGSMYGDHVHVFLNGLYWGMYNLHERPDERWSADHGEGDPVEHDWVKEGIVKAGNFGEMHDPVPGAFAEMNDVTANGLGPGVLYGGVPAYDKIGEYLDLEAYADYLLLNFFGGNVDWPQQNWMGTMHARLSEGLLDKNPDGRFRFQSWDAEATVSMEGYLVVGDGFYDRTSVSGSDKQNVAWYYTELLANPEFPLLLADRAQRAIFHPDGAFYVEPGFAGPGTPFDPAHPERNRAAAHFHALADRVDQAVIPEFARWANYFFTPGQFTPVDWYAHRDELLTQWFPVRPATLLSQLQNAGLFPSIVAPNFSQYGGVVPLGFSLTITAPAGTLYVTTDGTDPRLPGGAIASTAFAYAGPVAIVGATTVKARAFDGVEWSALVESQFATDIALRINEVMADNETTLVDKVGQFEDWIEVHNTSATPIDLGGMYLSDDLALPTMWQVPAGTIAPAGGSVLFWADDDELDGPLHTNFKLDKAGEEVGLFHTDLGGNLLIDGFAFGPQTADVSVGSMPDGGAIRYALPDPSPNAPNRPPAGASTRFDSPGGNGFALEVIGAPTVGQSFTLVVSDAPPGTVGAAFLGLATTLVPYVAGAGLTLPIVPEIWPAVIVDGAGSAAPTFGIPAVPQLAGATVYWQAWLTSLDLSNGVAITIAP